MSVVIQRKPTTINVLLIVYVDIIQISFIPAKPIHNHDRVSEHFNHFYCTDICDKLRRDLSMFT